MGLVIFYRQALSIVWYGCDSISPQGHGSKKEVYHESCLYACKGLRDTSVFQGQYGNEARQRKCILLCSTGDMCTDG